MTFESLPHRRAFLGIGVALALLLAAVGALRWGLALPFGGVAFLLILAAMGLLVLCGYVLYRTLLCLTMVYWVERDGVTVAWPFARRVIPMGHIQQIVLGAQDRGPGPWWTWPSRYVTHVDGGPRGRVISLATRPLPEQILLVTAEGVFGLSPADPEGFVEALQDRYYLGPTRPVKPGVQLPRVARWSVWRDRLAVGLLSLGLLGVVLLFGWLSFVYTGLPEQVPLHFNAQGVADRVGPRSGLLALPVIALLSWGVNGLWGGLVYARQRAAAYLLWGGAVVVQILASIALINLTR
ncbi:MAG: DUF1648 domain-containing protein [Chloroflexi bacterium]|nr:DUF1648 domain-containing protein [Chloroflexota bacterium]